MHFKQTDFNEVYDIVKYNIADSYTYGFIRRMYKNNIFWILFIMKDAKISSNKEHEEYNDENWLT